MLCYVVPLGLQSRLKLAGALTAGASNSTVSHEVDEWKGYLPLFTLLAGCSPFAPLAIRLATCSSAWLVLARVVWAI